MVGIIINIPKRSMSIEIQEFFDSLGKDKEPCAKGAFSLQRTTQKALFIEEWNNWLAANFYHCYGDNVKRWRGLRLQAVDGSTAYLMNRENVVAFWHPG